MAIKAKDPVYTWAFRSSQPRGGTVITYETRLEESGLLRCNCPGWIFSRGGQDKKECKHTRMIKSEVKEILTKFRNGDALPLYQPSMPVKVDSRLLNENALDLKVEIAKVKPKFGRLIEI